MSQDAHSILFITRKHPPSVGGMQKMHYEIRKSLEKAVPTKSIAWGHSQALVPLFAVYAFGRALLHLLLSREHTVILIGDVALSPIGYALKVVTGRPVGVFVHGLDISFSHFLYDVLVGPFRSRLDLYFCISRGTRDLAEAEGLPRNRLRVLNLGVAPDFALGVQKSEARSRIEILLDEPLEGRPLIVSAGRLVERKGVHWFLRSVYPKVLERHPDSLVLVAGTGPLTAQLGDVISKEKLEANVRLLGRISDEQLQFLLRAADIFIMPNIKVQNDFEGFGLVVLEAAINEAYVIAADVDGIRDAMMGDRIGASVPPGEPEMFADVLSRALRNEKERLRRAAVAREYCIENCTWDTVVQNLIQQLQAEEMLEQAV